jgi:hypothetical protein
MKFEKSRTAVERLTPEQRRITQESGTERPFTGEHTDNKEPGIYVDIVSGEPLFASTDKFDSGTGWPSFTKPIVPATVNEVRDSGTAWSGRRSGRYTPTAISATCSRMVLPTAAVCATASTQRPFASSRATKWKPRDTASISFR